MLLRSQFLVGFLWPLLAVALAAIGSAQASVLPRIGWTPEPNPDRTVAVCVAFALGTPPDEACALVLEATPPDAVVDRAAPIARAFQMFEPRWFEVDRSVVRDGQAVELMLPADAEQIRLRLESRYIHLDHGPLYISRPSAEPLVVDTVLGEGIRLDVVVPEGSVHPRPVGTEVIIEEFRGGELEPWKRHRVVIADDLSCSVKAVARGHMLRWGGSMDGTLIPAEGGLPRHVLAVGGTDVDASNRMLVLHDLIPVRGRVLDALGRPVGGAVVRATVPSCPGRTGSDGRFALPLRADRERTLEVDAAGFELASIETSTAGGVHELNLGDVLLTRLMPIKGRVVRPDGTPVAGFPLRIAASLPRSTRAEVSSYTDGSGRFVLEPLLRDAALLFGHSRLEPEGFDVYVPPRAVLPGELGLELVLQRAPCIAGSARFDDGSLPERVHVMAWCTGVSEAPNSFRHYGSRSEWRPARMGIFDFNGLHAGTWRMFARAPMSRQVE